jgi:hypothetical protein
MNRRRMVEKARSVRLGWVLCAALSLALCPTAAGLGPASAQEASPSPSPLSEAALVHLQNEAANPIADLVSIPFQYNLNFDYGPDRLAQQVLNIEPIIPASLGDGHTLINRIVVPFEVNPVLGAKSASQLGLGDVNPQFYYVPHQGPVMFGYGPTFVAPTGAGELGEGKWSVGPDAILVITERSRVYGLLVNNVWSVAGDDARAAVNQGFLQAYAHFALSHGLGVGMESTTTVNWNAPGTNKWLVPFGPTAAQIVPLGSGMNGQIVGGAFWNAVRPQGGGTFTGRLQFTILESADPH